MANIGLLIQRPDVVTHNVTDISKDSIAISKDDKEVKGQLKDRTLKSKNGPDNEKQTAKDFDNSFKGADFKEVAVKGTSDPSNETSENIKDSNESSKDVSDPFKDAIKSVEPSQNVGGSDNQLDKNEGRHKKINYIEL